MRHFVHHLFSLTLLLLGVALLSVPTVYADRGDFRDQHRGQDSRAQHYRAEGFQRERDHGRRYFQRDRQAYREDDDRRARPNRRDHDQRARPQRSDSEPEKRQHRAQGAQREHREGDREHRHRRQHESGRDLRHRERSDRRISNQREHRGTIEQRARHAKRLAKSERHRAGIRHRDYLDARHQRRHDHYRHSYRGRPKYRLHRRHRYVYYRTPWYHTRYLAPIHRHYHPIGHRVRVLPRHYIRFVLLTVPYFYFDGIFYQEWDAGYVVVQAPVGASIRVLPTGYIAFNNGFDTFFYVNATYYRWSDSDAAFVVVDKPDHADEAMDEAIKGRIYAYPNANQSEEQQAKDRYECHQWAVTEAHVDPTLEDEVEDLAVDDVVNYRRALMACLEGRDYTVE